MSLAAALYASKILMAKDLALALTLAALTVSLWVNKIACRALMLTFQFIALTKLWTHWTRAERLTDVWTDDPKI